MAKYEATIRGHRLAEVRAVIEKEILHGSVSASLEDVSDFEENGSVCSVRVFERYSWIGGNRVSLSVTLFQGAGSENVCLSAIASGGSQAMFFKINTFGEQAFLERLENALKHLS